MDSYFQFVFSVKLFLVKLKDDNLYKARLFAASSFIISIVCIN